MVQLWKYTKSNEKPVLKVWFSTQETSTQKVSYSPDSFAELQTLGFFQKFSVWKQIHFFA